MKKFLLLGVAIFVLFVAQAQKVYFIYLQTDNSSPFYLKMGDKIFSSTSEGYLILPKLTDSTYTFNIGRPAKSVSEVKFSVDINKSDRGLLIKELDGVLQLFDMQTMELIKPQQIPYAADEVANNNNIKRTDAFSILLAKAADDSTLLYRPAVAKKAEKQKVVTPAATSIVKTEAVETVNKDSATSSTAIVDVEAEKSVKDTTATISTETAMAPAIDTVTKSNVTIVENKEPVKEDVVIKEEKVEESNEVVAQEYVPSKVRRYSESSTSSGFGLVFLDNMNGVVDTIRILIPNQTNVFKTNTNTAVTEQKQFLDISNTTAEKGFENVAQSVDTIAVAKKENEATLLVTVPQSGKVANCKNIAMESDFKKLRKYMAAKETDGDMIDEARKAFKVKCFSTEQIKNLSPLFLTDEGKYRFFETAYSYIIDPYQFSSLQSELKEEYYINRLKALTGK